MQPVSKTIKLPRKNGRSLVLRNGSPKPFQWTVKQYYKMADLGYFQGRRVELINGEIIEMAPMKSPHAVAITLLVEVLSEKFGERFSVRSQLPLRLDEKSEPEPDIAIVKGKARDYSESHPNHASLIVEVSNSTLRFDRGEKAGLYAQFGIADYWILNLKDRCLEVCREPSSDDGIFFYAERFVVDSGSEISPLAKPKTKIMVADILP
ncbi:MAG: Uma2 family endonuclease [Pyrinomonadaceae bacterium]